MADALTESKWDTLRTSIKAISRFRALGINQSYGATDSSSGATNLDEAPSSGTQSGHTSSHELLVLLKLAVPVALGMAAQKLMMNTTSAVVARLGSQVLAGTVLAVNLTDMPGDILYAMLGPLSTLVSEAMGSKEGHMAGEWLQLAIWMVVGGGVPLCFFFIFGTGPVVSGLTSDEKVVEIAIMVNRILVPGLMVLWLYTALRSYLHGLKIVIGTSVAGIGAVVFNIFATYLLVVGVPSAGFDGLGLAGAMIAMNLSFVFQAVVAILVSITFSSKFKSLNAWGGWTSKAIGSDRIATFGKQALPLTASGMAESWGCRILIMASGALGANAVATFNIVNVFKSLLYSVFSGFGVAIQVQIAKKLGKGQPETAQTGFRAISAAIVVLCSVMTISTFMFRATIASFYAKPGLLFDTLVMVLPIVCIDFVLGTFTTLCKHTLMGMCEANIVLRTSLVSTWLVQLPVSVGLAMYTTCSLTTGVYGFVWGGVAQNACSALMLGYKVYNLDWEEQSNLALARQKESRRAPTEQRAPLLQRASSATRAILNSDEAKEEPKQLEGCSEKPKPTAASIVDKLKSGSGTKPNNPFVRMQSATKAVSHHHEQV